MVESRGLALVREVPPGYLAHYVVDASVALKWIVTEDLAEEARQYAGGASSSASCSGTRRSPAARSPRETT